MLTVSPHFENMSRVIFGTGTEASTKADPSGLDTAGRIFCVQVKAKGRAEAAARYLRRASSRLGLAIAAMRLGIKPNAPANIRKTQTKGNPPLAMSPMNSAWQPCVKV